MTKKHFEAAEYVRMLREYAPMYQYERVEIETPNLGNVDASDVRAHWIAYALADVFSSSNPRFDRERFYKACGLIVLVLMMAACGSEPLMSPTPAIPPIVKAVVDVPIPAREIGEIWCFRAPCSLPHN